MKIQYQRAAQRALLFFSFIVGLSAMAKATDEGTTMQLAQNAIEQTIQQHLFYLLYFLVNL